MVGLPEIRRPAFWYDAACLGAGVDLWYPTQGEVSREARAVCASCPVREECLEWALENHEHGVWGGTNDRQRRKIRRERRRERVPDGQ